MRNVHDSAALALAVPVILIMLVSGYYSLREIIRGDKK